MSALTHKANLVAELQSRLAEAMADEDQDFLAEQLAAAGGDLEATCAAILREGRARKAMAEGLDSVIDDAKARKKRLLEWDEKAREAVAHAMQEAGLPKIVYDDMTVSFRQNKPGIAFACDPDVSIADQYGGFIKMKEVYSWDKEAVREWLDAGNTLSFAKLTNAPPSLTLRSK